MLDGHAQNGKYWFLNGGLYDVQYTTTSTDTVTGQSRPYNETAAWLAGCSSDSADSHSEGVDSVDSVDSPAGTTALVQHWTQAAEARIRLTKARKSSK